MSDLISRGKLFNLLAPVQTLGEAYGIIQKMPTVDAVPVVRCKDCEYRERYGADIIYCERHSMMTAPDCFCSDGNNEGDIVSNCYDCPMNPDSDAWMR